MGGQSEIEGERWSHRVENKERRSESEIVRERLAKSGY